eukprot:gnl/TRDRNA2_/TRDRNA2_150052_c1_seq3.p1 gnl/TRDRNA2_/TRDRNA2_150052_c1~~gnl/TRDRNA2_/TRDRNA2_150052_c1_seq3.p1  ORF type:complete len:426 (-),score=79.63 gnl/TRDRNA2_/TRDRNA2_150052_c1_seq3:56-1279(-)
MGTAEDTPTAKKLKTSNGEAIAKLQIIAVGCGEPKKAMGWYHLTQLLEMSSVDVRISLHAVIEPWYLGKGKGGPGSSRFEAFCEELRTAHPKIQFYACVQDMPALLPSPDTATMALISGRTCDAQASFEAMILKGVTHVYLEKPGAETTAQLNSMREVAASKGVSVLMGYNKNAAQYSRDGLAEFQRRKASLGIGPLVTLQHCNAISPDELKAFMLGPGGEGMVHNMCCHELALAATLFGVTRDRITRVTIVPEKSELLDLGEKRADWKSLCFRLQVKGASLPEIQFSIDRCGGNFSAMHVEDAIDGKGTSTMSFRTPNAEHEKWVEKAQAEDPEIRSYFLLQKPDYSYLKRAFFEHIFGGKPGAPPELVGIDGAVQTLELADFLKPTLKECMSKGPPYIWEATPAL